MRAPASEIGRLDAKNAIGVRFRIEWRKERAEVAIQLAQRIRLARRHAGWTQEELANRVGTRRSAVSHWESAHSKSPTLARLQVVAVETGVAFEWLATGRGDMLLPREIMEANVAAATGLFTEDPAEARLISAYRHAPAEARALLLELVEILASRRQGRRLSRS